MVEDVTKKQNKNSLDDINEPLSQNLNKHVNQLSNDVSTSPMPSDAETDPEESNEYVEHEDLNDSLEAEDDSYINCT